VKNVNFVNYSVNHRPLSHLARAELRSPVVTTGIRTFRSPVLSLLRAKVPSGNLHSQERKFPGTFTPGNECSRELSFLV